MGGIRKRRRKEGRDKAEKGRDEKEGGRKEGGS